MAVVGAFLLIIIGAILIWLGLMNKFEKIGNKVTGRFEKTFGETKGEEKR